MMRAGICHAMAWHWRESLCVYVFFLRSEESFSVLNLMVTHYNEFQLEIVFFYKMRILTYVTRPNQKGCVCVLVLVQGKVGCRRCHAYN
jgi:hypothetical protein